MSGSNFLNKFPHVLTRAVGERTDQGRYIVIRKREKKSPAYEARFQAGINCLVRLGESENVISVTFSSSFSSLGSR